MNINIISMDGKITNLYFNCAACRHFPECQTAKFENECRFLGAVRTQFKTVEVVSDFRTNMPRYVRLRPNWIDLRAGESVAAMQLRAENTVNAIRDAMTQTTR